MARRSLNLSVAGWRMATRSVGHSASQIWRWFANCRTGNNLSGLGPSSTSARSFGGGVSLKPCLYYHHPISYVAICAITAYHAQVNGTATTAVTAGCDGWVASGAVGCDALAGADVGCSAAGASEAGACPVPPQATAKASSNDAETPNNMVGLNKFVPPDLGLNRIAVNSRCGQFPLMTDR